LSVPDEGYATNASFAQNLILLKTKKKY